MLLLLSSMFGLCLVCFGCGFVLNAHVLSSSLMRPYPHLSLSPGPHAGSGGNTLLHHSLPPLHLLPQIGFSVCDPNYVWAPPALAPTSFKIHKCLQLSLQPSGHAQVHPLFRRRASEFCFQSCSKLVAIIQQESVALAFFNSSSMCELCERRILCVCRWASQVQRARLQGLLGGGVGHRLPATLL